jgi:phosphate transport system substrate-binding protein
MKYLLSAALLSSLLVLTMPVAKAAEEFSGAGSSAAAPIYKAWASRYEKASGVTLQYEASGSSAGLKKIRAGETSFGASDIAPSEADLNTDALVVFPIAITGVVPVVNLPKIADGQLHLSGEVLARIYLGEIERWNAAEIRELNPNLALPDLPIKIIGRSDGSGTTYNFTDYLSKVSLKWKERFGTKPTIAWPAGVIGAAGSGGVVRAVASTTGAIGYVDHGYVVDNKLTGVQMRNADGNFVRSGAGAFQSALSQSDWISKGSFTSTLTQRPGKASWPITMATFALVPRVSDKPEQTKRALQFFLWAFKNGDAYVDASFVRLPDRVQAAAFKAIASVRAKSGEPIGLMLF